MLIVKDRDATGGWRVWTPALSSSEDLLLDTTAAINTGRATWNTTLPTASVFSVGNVW